MSFRNRASVKTRCCPRYCIQYIYSFVKQGDETMATGRGRKSLPEKLAQSIQKSLENGDMGDDIYLPSSRDLAGRYGTSLVTMQKALKRLEKDEVIALHSKRRGFVRIDKSSAGVKRGFGAKGMAAKRIAVLMEGTDSSEKPTVSDRSSVFYEGWGGNIFFKMMECLAFDRFNCIPLFHDPSEIKVSEIMSQLKNDGGIDGLVFISSPSLEGLPESLDQQGVRWLSINPMKGIDRNYVTADNLNGAKLVGKYFAKMGFKNVLYISTAVSNLASSGMYELIGLMQGYLSAGGDFGGITHLVTESVIEADGQRVVLDYLENHESPDAIFCFGDDLALGAISACKGKGLNVPGDVSVLGGTGMPYSAVNTPRLSVLAQPMVQISKIGAAMN